MAASTPTNPILDLIKGVLKASPSLRDEIAWDAWATDQTIRAEKVALFREYADGQHRGYMTPEIRQMLRIPAGTETSAFTINHMLTIIQTPVDRLHLTSVRGDSDEATEWTDALLNRNRVDGFQMSVHEAAMREGDTFVLAEWDNDAKLVRWSEEDAFDGIEGMIGVYGRDQRYLTLAIKIWQESQTNGGQVTTRARINFYWPDRIERYVQSSQQLVPYAQNGMQAKESYNFGGVPVIHFPNDANAYSAWGKSIIEDVIPVQDSLNRLFMSAVAAAELTAFRINFAKGFVPPSVIAPGMWVNLAFKDKDGKAKGITEDEKRTLDAASIQTLNGADLSQYLSLMSFLIDSMYEVARMPRPHGRDGNASGESLKQREIGLLGRVRRAHVTFGNAWEDLLRLSAQIEAAYGGKKPPTSETYTAVWASGEVRNDTQALADAMVLRDIIDHRTLLELVAPVYDWDAEKIDAIMTARDAEIGRQMQPFRGVDSFGSNATGGSAPAFDEGSTDPFNLTGVSENGSN